METKIEYTLEMSSASELRPSRTEVPGLEIRKVEVPSPEYNWFFHQAVGVAYRWGGREEWDEEKWTQYVDRPELETWVGYVRGAPAGYFELERQEDRSVRIQSFGLLGRFVGQGVGGPFLTVAVECAWALGASRVWLQTCTHDHPHALPNYEARGFKLVAETAQPANRERGSMIFRSG